MPRLIDKCMRGFIIGGAIGKTARLVTTGSLDLLPAIALAMGLIIIGLWCYLHEFPFGNHYDE